MTDCLHTVHDYQWTGRHDPEDGDLGKRVHHIVQCRDVETLNDYPHAVSLLGFACDAGVVRNQGRLGAHQAPNVIKQALANLAWHHQSALYDLGTIRCEGDALEQAQSRCAQVITKALSHSPVIVLGGGHEVAWASFQGLAQHLRDQGITQPRIGIINFDAHFDLRAFASEQTVLKPSSGTPFHQIQHYCAEHQWEFHYACLGVSRASNTSALFQRADQLGVWYVEDCALSLLNYAHHAAALQHFIDECDYLYLTIDLDVFSAAFAPGVSAPAARGVSLETLTPYLAHVLQHTNKLIMADIAEYNPTYDRDHQTARLAARLCWEIADAMTASLVR